MSFARKLSACDGCVAEDCPTCSPSTQLGSVKLDLLSTKPSSITSKPSASIPDASNIDVYQRNRISEKLKIERDLFPECIQAPIKYCNKRKSLRATDIGKENRAPSYFSGQNTTLSETVKMNKSKNYVLDWLSKNENVTSRLTLSDLKINVSNEQLPFNVRSETKKSNQTNITLRKSKRKCPRLIERPSTSHLPCHESYECKAQKDKKCLSALKLEKEFNKYDKKSKLPQAQGKHCNESGIVIDYDCITIEDTQSQLMDKDKLALMAVEAFDMQHNNSSLIMLDSITMDDQCINSEKALLTKQSDDNKQVPFYKKGYLFKDCEQCIENKDKAKVTSATTSNSHDISITVSNKSFITTIQVMDCVQESSSNKPSTAVQTELNMPSTSKEYGIINKMYKLGGFKENVDKITNAPESQDLFGDDIQKSLGQNRDIFFPNVTAHDTEVNTIEETNVLFDKLHKQSENELGVLAELDGSRSQQRSRKRTRGTTPDSNNSSNKENYDPNRKKKLGGVKKKNKKRKKSMKVGS